MQPWNAAPPPDLPVPSPAARAGGVLRVAGILAVTGLALGIFLLGRALRGALGRRVTFHFEAVRLWSLACLWLLGLRVRVRGEPVHAGALVANHSTWLDILVLRAIRLIYFVSKAEVATWPGIGFITRVTGTIFIDRRRTEAKRQEALLRSRIAHDQLLCFFPEGTSTDGQRVLPFKSSLFSAFWKGGEGTALPVQPVTIRYEPPPGLPMSFYGWWGDMSFERSIWTIATRSRGGMVEVIFHSPVAARDFPGRKELAEHCRAAVVLGLERGAAAPALPRDGEHPCARPC
ncbi:MAG TPA: lysophospholipid acyltransferase family protein [Paracoccaceae bacterium]|nr:lysophospholipid acyltransferase family protein [Paracoccaceae bacterium]